MKEKAESVLKLSARERAVLKGLRGYKRSESVTHIAMSSDLPRTTTGLILNSLRKRGFATRVKVRNHYEWQLAHPERLSDSLAAVAGSTDDLQSLHMRTLQGIENITGITETIARLSRGERVYSIQGNVSAELGLKKLPREYLARLHESLKEREVVIAGIIGEKSLKTLLRSSTEELLSHVDRLVVVHVVPDQYLDFDCDIVVVRDTVITIRYQSLVTQIIKDPVFAGAMKSLVSFMEDKGEKVDLNASIRKELKGR